MEVEGKAGRARVFFNSRLKPLSLSGEKEHEQYELAYAITVHKAQGSQWDDVMLFDESFAFREHRARWLYTGLTRAARRLTVVK